MMLVRIDHNLWVSPNDITAIGPSNPSQGGQTTILLRSGGEVYSAHQPHEVIETLDWHAPLGGE